MGVGREAFEVVLHVLVQHLVLGQQVRETPQLGAGGQLAHDDQVGHLDEGGFLRQLLDGDAAVAQDALLAVDEGDLALAGTGVAVAVVQRDVAGLVAQRGDVHRALLFGAFDNRKLAALSVQYQFGSLFHKQLSLKVQSGKNNAIPMSRQPLNAPAFLPHFPPRRAGLFP